MKKTIDLEYKGIVDVNDRVLKLQKRVLKVAEDYLRRMEEELEDIVHQRLDRAMLQRIDDVLGVSVFGDIKRDGKLAQAMTPYIEAVLQKWVQALNNQPLSAAQLKALSTAFTRGHDAAADDIAYKLGQDYAAKQGDCLRFELLGTDDLLEQTESKMTHKP